RRGLFAVVLARHRATEGAAADVRALVETTAKTFGELSPYAPDLYTALGKAEMKANHPDAALAAFRKAADAADKQSMFPGDRGGRHMDVAEALHASGKAGEAKTAMARAIEVSGGDPGVLARASALTLALKDHNQALDLARKAVAASQNEDPAAQAALGAALQASGDAAGAAAAYQRAADFAPENADYKKRLLDTKKSRATPKPS
ncbi:MAG TPA: hypothetical protein VGR00_08795, partial [Thermoanaerobaculia bacterium]|nr:hypothetical protein [Thermoanaerobaculia bacterium]